LLLLLLIVLVLVLCFLHAESFICASETESPDCSKPPSPGALEQPRFLARWLAGCGPFPPRELLEALKRADLPKSAKERKGKKKREILKRDSFFQFCDFAQLAIIHKYI
jgi:hypothetical protein